MGVTKTTVLKLTKPNIGQERGEWGKHLNANFDTLDSIVSLNRQREVRWGLAVLPGALASPLAAFGQEIALGATGIALVDPTPVVRETGTSQVSVDVKAGTTLTGTIEISGDSRHKATGAITVGDTETLAISGVGRYSSGKVWIGSVTLTPGGGLDVSDADILSTALFDDCGKVFRLKRVRFLGRANAAGLTATVSMYLARSSSAGLALDEILGGKLDVPATGVSPPYYFDHTCEPGESALDGGRGEGLLALVDLSGLAGEWTDVSLQLTYWTQADV